MDVQLLKEHLKESDIEVYRVDGGEIHIAERVRVHIMDSGVRVVPQGSSSSVSFSIRCQRSDFPNASVEQLLSSIRAWADQAVLPRGYAEVDTQTVEIHDPIDDSRVLDVWHEVVFARGGLPLEDLADEVRWAIAVDKYIHS